MLLQMTVLLLPLLWLPLPLLLPWLRLLLGVWFSLSRADDGAVVWWQDCTEPAVCGRRAFRRLFSSRPCVFFFAAGRPPLRPPTVAMGRPVLCRVLAVEVRPLGPYRGAAHGADGLVHSPSLTGWYTVSSVCVCVLSCVCVCCVVCV